MLISSCRPAFPFARFVQGLSRIVTQVLEIFAANRDANQFVHDAGRFPLRARNRGVSHRRGVLDQRFNTSQRDRQREQP